MGSRGSNVVRNLAYSFWKIIFHYQLKQVFDPEDTLKPLLLVTCSLCGKIWLTFSVASGLLGFLSGWCFSAIWNKQPTKTALFYDIYNSPAKGSLTSLVSTVQWPVYIDQIKKLTFSFTIKLTKLWTLKNVWSVYCVITNHESDLQTIETTEIGSIPSVTEQMCLVSTIDHQTINIPDIF